MLTKILYDRKEINITEKESDKPYSTTLEYHILQDELPSACREDWQVNFFGGEAKSSLCLSYGVMVSARYENAVGEPHAPQSKAVHGLTPFEDEARRIARILADNVVTPTSAADVVEDLIAAAVFL